MRLCPPSLSNGALKFNVESAIFDLMFPSFSGRRQVRHGRDPIACWRPFDLDP